MWRSNFLYNLTSQFLQKLSLFTAPTPRREQEIVRAESRLRGWAMRTSAVKDDHKSRSSLLLLELKPHYERYFCYSVHDRGEDARSGKAVARQGGWGHSSGTFWNCPRCLCPHQTPRRHFQLLLSIIRSFVKATIIHPSIYNCFCYAENSCRTFLELLIRHKDITVCSFYNH